MGPVRPAISSFRAITYERTPPSLLYRAEFLSQESATEWDFRLRMMLVLIVKAVPLQSLCYRYERVFSPGVVHYLEIHMLMIASMKQWKIQRHVFYIFISYLRCRKIQLLYRFIQWVLINLNTFMFKFCILPVKAFICWRETHRGRETHRERKQESTLFGRWSCCSSFFFVSLLLVFLSIAHTCVWRIFQGAGSRTPAVRSAMWDSAASTTTPWAGPITILTPKVIVSGEPVGLLRTSGEENGAEQFRCVFRTLGVCPLEAGGTLEHKGWGFQPGLRC